MVNLLKKDPNFEIIINIFNSNNIPYWLCHGTLLGIIRDKKLIDWDNDIDLAVWSNQVNRKEIINLIIKKGFKLREGFGVDLDVVQFDRQGGRMLDINFYKVIKNNINKDNAYIIYHVPKNIFIKLVDALAENEKYNGKYKRIINFFFLFSGLFKSLKKYLKKKKLFYKQTGYAEPLNLIKKSKTIYFQDLEVKVPFKPEEYLEYIYGIDWKVPKKNYFWYKGRKSII